jgi:uncharacterized protein YeaO (DUF488 family)
VRVTLVTCSYKQYQPTMGAAVRITLGAPKGKLAPRYLFELRELAPRGYYINADDETFRRRYRHQLHKATAATLRQRFRSVAQMSGRRQLVLLCFETAQSKDFCHRTLFAQWWIEQTGEKVAELGTAPPLPSFGPPEPQPEQGELFR